MSCDIFQSIFYISACFLFCYLALMYTKTFMALSKQNTAIKNVHIVLDEKDFSCLVRGGVLKVLHFSKNQSIDLILSDIGFERMAYAMAHADKEENLYEDHEKVIL